MRTGLCSVTLRSSSPAEVVAVAADAGLAAIEWGTDVHAPVDDPARLADVAARTTGAGLAVAALGSYLVLGRDSAAERAAVVDAAVRTGAPRIRVWAGRGTGSAEADAGFRRAVADSARELAARAADAGVTVGLEFHGGTLTDTVESTLDLLSEVGHDALGTYWQPPVGLDDDAALAGLDAVRPHVVAVHAFSWMPERTRLPLDARADLWRRALDRFADDPADVLLEFVPDDDPAGVVRDAATLHRILAPVPGR